MSRAVDRDFERILATQPGYVPASQRPKRTTTSLIEVPVGKPGPVGYTKSDKRPYKNYYGEMVQSWFKIETF